MGSSQSAVHVCMQRNSFQRMLSDCFYLHFSNPQVYRVSGKALLDISPFSLISVFLSISDYDSYILGIQKIILDLNLRYMPSMFLIQIRTTIPELFRVFQWDLEHVMSFRFSVHEKPVLSQRKFMFLMLKSRKFPSINTR